MSLRVAAAGLGRAAQWRLRPMSLTLTGGEIHAVLGPNGAGKTTLLSLLAGDLRPSHGLALLDDRPLQNWSPQALARRRAVYGQDETLHFAFTVAEVVGLGNLPWWGETPPERALIEAALQAVDAETWITRSVMTLSGGEQARVRLARTLVQLWSNTRGRTGYLLLDEPTAHLDFAFQHRALQLIRQVANDGYGVLLVVHDPNLALRYADRVTLLARGGVIAQGPVETRLTAETASQAYGVPVRRQQRPGGGWMLEVDTDR